MTWAEDVVADAPGRNALLPPRWWQAALPEAERPRAEQPEWAAFTEDVLISAPPRPVVPDGHHPDLTGFAHVLAPFADRASAHLAGLVSGAAGRQIDLPSLRGEFTAGLLARLTRTAARTLVLELGLARVAGRLTGDSPAERFSHFLRLTGGRAGLARLLGEYPVLARLLALTCLNTADALAEMLGRLARDRPLLTARPLGGTVPGRLVSVDASAGDLHDGGRSVMLLRFADGARLVYKPRSLGAHRHFNDVADWFNAQPGTADIRTLAVADRGAYGWAEFVDRRPCGTGQEAEAFYRRQGSLLALLHVLDGTDTHYENVIACGPHPVLVDVETLFHPPVRGALAPSPVPGEPEAAEDPAARVFQDSVQRIGLLPRLLFGDDGALDISGIGGGRAAVAPVAGVAWDAAGTDEMRLVRRPRQVGEARNRPELDGTLLVPAAFTESVLGGFRSGYDAIRGARTELTEPGGLLRAFAPDDLRVVARPTQVYATLLDESTHPSLLRDAKARDEVLRLLPTERLGAPGLPALVEHELAGLWAGDVPLFVARADSAELRGPGNARIREVLAEPGLRRAAAKVAALSPMDRADQEWIIRATMASTSTAPAHRGSGGSRGPAGVTAPEPEHLLAAARRVGDQLVAQAHRGPRRANWLGMELLAERYWRVGPQAADLAAGYTGTALFLAQLADLTGASRYAEVARDALAPVPGLLTALSDRPHDLGTVGSGAFTGLGGITYALVEVARLLADPVVAEPVTRAVRLISAAAEREQEWGVRSGLAGGLAALTAVHTATGGAGARQAAERCAARLLDVSPWKGAVDGAGAGMADGAAGVGWALLRFAGTGGGDVFRDAGLAALRSAMDAMDAVDGVDATDTGAAASAWCGGRAGVALAVIDSGAASADARFGAWARRTTLELARSEPLPDDSLCHGEFGVLELVGHADLRLDRPFRTRRAGAVLAGLDRYGPRGGVPGTVQHPGLLTGLAGIGHGLLRAGFADRVPSALLLHAQRP